MLTLIEKILFALASLASLTAAWFAVKRLIVIIGQGQGQPDWDLAWKRMGRVLIKVGTFQPVFRFRFLPSLFHALIGWGFAFFLLVNIGDILQAYLPNYEFLGGGITGNLFRLFGDFLSISVLVGMTFMLVRRFILKPHELRTRDSIQLNPKARFGINRDFAIVGSFILFHVGSRFMGESFKIALLGHDAWQPFASLLAGYWSGWSEWDLIVGQHITFWLALGLILVFIPYFPYSKHIHLFFAPLNFLLKPVRRSPGELSKLNFDDETIEQFGASILKDLGWEQILDAYACIMCFRYQEVCPAYHTGKVLSPAALEINKRYALNYVGAPALPDTSLTDIVIPDVAVFACTTCGACIDICPVGNEPMRDILDIRRSLVLMDNNFPKQWETAFRSMERNANPWNTPPAERMNWAEGLKVPTIEQNPEPEILWWVGCAPSADARAQKTAQAFTKIMNTARVNYAVLGQKEQCTGDSARRAGNEYLFAELANANVKILNEIKPKRIVTTCPHCLNTIKNDYPAFGGYFQVIHHTQMIKELIDTGRLELKPKDPGKVTYHDPCYLGRHNQIYAEPRILLKKVHHELVEMPRHGAKSFCCGAGGAQMWKEEEHGTANVNHTRFAEAKDTGVDTIAVGCPFCMTMLSDASKANGGQVKVLDIAEIVSSKLR